MRNAADKLHQREAHVFSVQGIGTRLLHQDAFIHKDVFEAKFGVPPGTKGVSAKLFEAPGLEGNKVPGAILSLNGIPADVPYDIVERFATSHKVLRRTLLGPQGLCKYLFTTLASGCNRFQIPD